MTFAVGQKGKNKIMEKEKERLLENIDNYIELIFSNKNKKLRNQNVRKYAEICKNFSRETYNYIHLNFDKKYLVTNNGNWSECNNTEKGIDVSWAFRLNDDEIEFFAGEQLFENLMIFIDELMNNTIDDNTLLFGLDEHLNNINPNIRIDILEKVYYLFNI